MRQFSRLFMSCYKRKEQRKRKKINTRAKNMSTDRNLKPPYDRP